MNWSLGFAVFLYHFGIRLMLALYPEFDSVSFLTIFGTISFFPFILHFSSVILHLQILWISIVYVCVCVCS